MKRLKNWLVLIFVSSVLFWPGRTLSAEVPVHAGFSLSDKEDTSFNVIANGCRYRIFIVLNKKDYVYKDVKITEPDVGGVWTSEVKDEEYGWYIQYRWQTPVLTTQRNYTIRLSGKRMRKGPGVGPAVWEPWHTEGSGDFGFPKFEIKTPEKDMTLKPDATQVIEAYAEVGAAIPELKADITTCWGLTKTPVNAKGDVGPETSKTNTAGIAATALTVSETIGDMYEVRAQNKVDKPDLEYSLNSRTFIVGVDYLKITPESAYLPVSKKKEPTQEFKVTAWSYGKDGIPSEDDEELVVDVKADWEVIERNPSNVGGKVKPEKNSSTTTFTAGTIPGTCKIKASWKKKDAKAEITAFKVEITEPNYQPVTDNNCTFDEATPGVCNVLQGSNCIAKIAPDILNTDENKGKIEWILEQIKNSDLTSTPSPAKGPEVRFTYKKLPEKNNQFGNKDLEAKVTLYDKQSKDEKIVQIFYTKETTNHPAPKTGIDPNWYYYWSQTSASSGTHIYEARTDRYGYYEFGKKYFVICTPAAGINNNTGHNGIDCFAETCIHENTHMADYWNWWPEGYVENADKDKDYIPDSIEPSLGFDPTKQDTDGDGHIDFEDRAFDAEHSWKVASADSEDWANPGHQSDK